MMSPLHGEDRRFESGWAHHISNVSEPGQIKNIDDKKKDEVGSNKFGQGSDVSRIYNLPKHELEGMIKFLSNVKKTKYERTRTPQGKLLFSIVGAFAEFERSLIQERVKLGLRRAVANGTKLGRPKLEVNKYQVLNMRNQGMSYRQIAKQLNISHVSINNLLKC